MFYYYGVYTSVLDGNWITLRLDFIYGYKRNLVEIYNLYVLLTDASQVKGQITFIAYI